VTEKAENRVWIKRPAPPIFEYVDEHFSGIRAWPTRRYWCRQFAHGQDKKPPDG